MLGLIFFWGDSWGAKPKSDQNVRELERIVSQYKNANSIVLNVNKTVKSELLGKETAYVGVITFSKGKFHWITEKPEKSLLIFDGNIFWTIQYPPEEFKAAPQVAKTVLNKNKQAPYMITILLGPSSLQKNFEISTAKVDGDIMNFNLKEKDNKLGVKDLQIKVNKKSEKILGLNYLDEVDNLTTLSFIKTKLNTNVKFSLFKFKAPKDAKIIEY
jgi:outer membrane lipoprotein carrier protein